MLPPPLLARRRGFTLIELLVVITIVAILAAILFPVYGSVQNNGRKTQAISDERNLVLAVLNYKADYNHLPLTPRQQSGAAAGFDTLYGDPGAHVLYPGYILINCLRGITAPTSGSNTDVPSNPSGTVYFTAPYVKDRLDPRHGVLQYDYNDTTPGTGYKMTAGSFVDPWGSEYVVFLDANNDHSLNVDTSYIYSSHPIDNSTHTYGPQGTVQVVSLGPDGNFGKNGDIPGSDDIVTVQ